MQYCISTLYTNQKAKFFTQTYSSTAFSFKRGVFQGDPLSPIIFLMVFNTIIELLQNETWVRVRPDDFCLITTNKKTHQRFMDLINSRIQSLGMKLKPSKCLDMNFDIQGTVIPTIFHEEQKFLGKVLFPLGHKIYFYGPRPHKNGPNKTGCPLY